MAYAVLENRLNAGEVVILDGGTGTELERRGVVMDPDAWCGPASLDHLDILEAVHWDYIAAGAEIITANTFASSPIMLKAARFEDKFQEINRAAVTAAKHARDASGDPNIVVAGSLSHMVPAGGGAVPSDPYRLPSRMELDEALDAHASLLKAEGCDLILLEMMHHPDRMAAAFDAAVETGLPIWAGFSARRSEDGRLLAYTADDKIPFSETVQILSGHDVAAAGIMHTSPNITGEALAILKEAYKASSIGRRNTLA